MRGRLQHCSLPCCLVVDHFRVDAIFEFVEGVACSVVYSCSELVGSSFDEQQCTAVARCFKQYIVLSVEHAAECGDCFLFVATHKVFVVRNRASVVDDDQGASGHDGMCLVVDVVNYRVF